MPRASAEHVVVVVVVVVVVLSVIREKEEPIVKRASQNARHDRGLAVGIFGRFALCGARDGEPIGRGRRLENGMRMRQWRNSWYG